jgi:hypothetical protein
MRLLAAIVQDWLNGPRVVYDAWADGQISDCDLRALIPDTWLYVDWPERVIGAGKWSGCSVLPGSSASPTGCRGPIAP